MNYSHIVTYGCDQYLALISKSIMLKFKLAKLTTLTALSTSIGSSNLFADCERKYITFNNSEIEYKSKNKFYCLLNRIGISILLFPLDGNYTTLTNDFIYQVDSLCKYSLICDETDTKLLKYPVIDIDKNELYSDGYNVTYVSGYTNLQTMKKVSLVRDIELWNKLSTVKCTNTLEEKILETIIKEYKLNGSLMYSLYVPHELYEKKLTELKNKKYYFLDRTDWYNMRTYIDPPPIAIE